MTNIIIISSFITFVLILVSMTYLYKSFSSIDRDRSSCREKIECSPRYDLSVSGIPISTPLCYDSVECRSLITPAKKTGIDLPDFVTDFAIPNPTCMEIQEGRELCCIGNIPRCLTNRLYLGAGEVVQGYSVAFNSTMCRALPSCFIENDESPYLLFPIPDMSVNLYSKDEDEHSFDFYHLDKTVATGFGLLGACAISPQQAMVYVIELPAYSTLAYFSLTPYLFQTGRSQWVNNYPQDTPFASMTDSFNLHSLENMSDDSIREWINGNTNTLEITVCASISKAAAEEVRLRLGDKRPFIVMPIPAGSTYGNSYGPDDEILLKDNRFNKIAFNETTKLFDWQRDTMAVVGRIAAKEGQGDNLVEWKTKFSKQYKSNVYGVTFDSIDIEQAELFELADQNGNYTEDGVFQRASGDGYTLHGWRKKGEVLDFDPSPKLQEKTDQITSWMKERGYNVSKGINVNSDPSPFSYYNKHVAGLTPAKWRWNQSGLSILQYNVAAFGDCRDTMYPSSDTFCMGPRDILVVIGNDYTNSSEYGNINITYNNLNVYDAQSQTSLASLRGTSTSATYALAVARSDHTCLFSDESAPAEFQFIPTGSHSNLAAAPTTSFFTQSRFYMDKSTGTSPNFTKDQQSFKVIVFSPCGDEGAPSYPVKCNDASFGGCYINPDPHSQECDLDLERDAKSDAERSDNLTAAICSKFRFEKTNRIQILNILYYLFAAVLTSIVVFAIYTVVTNRKVPPERIFDFLKPALLPASVAFIGIIASSDLLNQTIESSAYEINESVKQVGSV